MLYKKNILISAVLLLVGAGGVLAPTAYATQGDNHDYSGCGNNDSSGGASSQYCNSALGESVYELVEDGVNIDTNADTSNISVDGVNISVSAWSDTVGIYNDDIVTDATLVKISDSYGYGIYNADDEYYGSSPDHAIDSYNTVSYNVDHDFDFVLLSFSESVTLTGAGFSWIGNESDTQVSIAGLSDISGLTSGTQTWSNIVEDALTAGSYDIEYCEYVDHRADFTEQASAQYWLIGAYNSVFGNINGNMYNDAFKLTSIGFDTDSTDPSTGDPTAVSEPGTLGALLACSLFIMWRRRTVNH